MDQPEVIVLVPLGCGGEQPDEGADARGPIVDEAARDVLGLDRFV